MSYTNNEKKTFNAALKLTEGVKRDMLKAYKKALKSTKDKIAILRQKNIESPLQAGNTAQLKRLENLYTDIDTELKELFKYQSKQIEKGFLANWQDTNLSTGFNFEKEVNIGALSKTITFDLSIGFKPVNRGFMLSIFNAPIAGETFKDRMLVDRLKLQSSVKSAVQQAVVEGISVKDLAKRLKSVDNAFSHGANKALLTAQQELTTAYSYGQKDAYDTAIDNGVEGNYKWDSALDGKTRLDHRVIDGQLRNDETGLFKFADGTTIESPRLRGAGTAGLNQIMRCRCRALLLPFGIQPTTRAAKMPDGSWKEVNGDLNYKEWAKTKEGEKTIEKEVEYRKARAKRLANKRAKQ